jgi:hypothetical protein
MHRLMLLLAAALIAASMPRPALAQKPATADALLNHLTARIPLLHGDPSPRAFLDTAFARPYAKLLIAEFESVLRDSADRACVKTKAIATQGLYESARDILLRRGTQMMEVMSAKIDWAAFDANVADRAGEDAKTEMARLRNHPDVQTFLALARALMQGAVVEHVVENLRRYAIINRIRLVRGISPIETGNEVLLKASEEDDSYDKLADFLMDRKSPELAQYVRLALAVQEALADAFKSDAVLNLGVRELMPGLEQDLADLCIPGASR